MAGSLGNRQASPASPLFHAPEFSAPPLPHQPTLFVDGLLSEPSDSKMGLGCIHFPHRFSKSRGKPYSSSTSIGGYDLIKAIVVRKIDVTAYEVAPDCKPCESSQSSFDSKTDESGPQPLHISMVIEIGNVAYLLEQSPFHSLRLTSSPDLHPLAIFVAKEKPLTSQSMQKLIEQALEQDDVLCPDFMSSVTLVTQQDSLGDDVLEVLSSFGCKRLFLTRENLGRGPFFYSCTGIYRTYRLYPDTQNAFVTTTVPSPHHKNTYQAISASAYGISTLCVAVPSRLYFTPTLENPLAGLRLSVKDVFHLKGVPTSYGNKAYAQLYGKQQVNSAAVQDAIDKGAVIVGKTKTAEFAGSQEVEGDWADYSYPFNPRADGYLRSTGSSTGSASGVAAYSWLDGSLGSDAGGSVRDPAVVHGVMGFRPSHDGVSEQNTSLPCVIFQRSGYLARDSKLLYDLTLNGLRLPYTSSEVQRPKRVITIKEYACERNDVKERFEYAAERLCNWLHTELVRVSIEDIWKETRPFGTEHNFFSHFHKTFMSILTKEYFNHGAQFREDYHSKFQAAPYVCKVTQWLWQFGASVTTEEHSAARSQVIQHNKWFQKHMVDKETIMILPRYSLDYRDEYLPPPESRDWFGFDSNLHATFAGLPNLMVPIGQAFFESSVSRRQEIFPVSIAITGSQGTDLALLDLANAFLAENGFATKVQAGGTAFPE